MERYWLLIIILLMMMNMFGCQGSGKKNLTEKVVQDIDGNIYSVIRLNGQVWLNENLNLEFEDSWCYQNDIINCQQYGRLYTWDAAIQACKKLGDGWRLPTNAEWRALAKEYGGAGDDAQDGGKAAYQAMIEGGNSGFSAKLGGSRSSFSASYDLLGSRGFYWTSTEGDNYSGVMYFFISGFDGLRSGWEPKASGYSCRCIKGN